MKTGVARFGIAFAFCFALLFFLTTQPVEAITVSNRLITQIGTWTKDATNGNQTAYVRIDRVANGDPAGPVGPTTCSDTLLKIDFNDGGDSGKYTKSILILAFSSQMPVTLEVPMDRCVYGNPTFDTIYINRPN